eukprot:5944175-Pleurochrysis_carterae.AAC.3
MHAVAARDGIHTPPPWRSQRHGVLAMAALSTKPVPDPFQGDDWTRGRRQVTRAQMRKSRTAAPPPDLRQTITRGCGCANVATVAAAKAASWSGWGSSGRWSHVIPGCSWANELQPVPLTSCSKSSSRPYRQANAGTLIAEHFSVRWSLLGGFEWGFEGSAGAMEVAATKCHC